MFGLVALVLDFVAQMGLGLSGVVAQHTVHLPPLNEAQWAVARQNLHPNPQAHRHETKLAKGPYSAAASSFHGCR
jgi:hypothetical protein